MKYFEDRVLKLKQAKVEDFPYPEAKVEEPLWEYCKSVLEKVKLVGGSGEAPFMYYEKMAGDNRILGFRMPWTDSYLIYRCVVGNYGKNTRFFVKVDGIKGEESMDYFRATARTIQQFFRDAENCYEDVTDKTVSINVINMKNGKRYRRNVKVKFLDDDIVDNEQRITSSKCIR